MQLLSRTDQRVWLFLLYRNKIKAAESVAAGYKSEEISPPLLKRDLITALTIV